MQSSQKLRQSSGGSNLNKLVENYTVGDDYVRDQYLIPYDIQASIAHATMLHSINILNDHELEQAIDGLNHILSLWNEGTFIIEQYQEDGHTAIEQYLTEHYGDIGKKIHTGRSRNDQSLVMLRLFMKSILEQILESSTKLTQELDQLGNQTKTIPMPGYTHTQKAMPTTVGVRIQSYHDSVCDAAILIRSCLQMIDQNPLGSASGFGINNLKLDTDLTTHLMGFHKTQHNPLYCGLSRGLFDSSILSSLSHLMISLGRFANDMILFTTQEFGFFALDSSYTTGSSIMPQKRNYDLFEIMRGNTKLFLGYLQQIQSITASLGSGYHRDLQLTKKPFVLGIQLCLDTLCLMCDIIPNLMINHDRLVGAMTEDLYATDRVYELVAQGVSFRDAYHQIKEHYHAK